METAEQLQVVIGINGTVTFDGASDDCIHATVTGNSEEWYPAKDYHCSYMGCFLARYGGRDVLKVHILYDGCWTFAPGQPEEGAELPGLRFEHQIEHAYCLALKVIGLPHGTVITLEK